MLERLHGTPPDSRLGGDSRGVVKFEAGADERIVAEDTTVVEVVVGFLGGLAADEEHEVDDGEVEAEVGGDLGLVNGLGVCLVADDELGGVRGSEGISLRGIEMDVGALE